MVSAILTPFGDEQPSCASRPSELPVRVLDTDDVPIVLQDPPCVFRFPPTPPILDAVNMKRAQRAYDHRLVRLVQETGDTSIATRLGVPRSTAAGWIRRATKSVTTRPNLDESPAILRARVARLEKRVHYLTAVLRILLAVLRAFAIDLSHRRGIPSEGKARLLRAIE